MEDEPPWSTPSDLAEYVFCPRAHFYRRHASVPGSRATAAGTAYHGRELAAERWREEHRAAPWVLVAVGVGLVVLAALFLLP